MVRITKTDLLVILLTIPMFFLLYQIKYKQEILVIEAVIFDVEIEKGIGYRGSGCSTTLEIGRNYYTAYDCLWEDIDFNLWKWSILEIHNNNLVSINDNRVGWGFSPDYGNLSNIEPKKVISETVKYEKSFSRTFSITLILFVVMFLGFEYIKQKRTQEVK